MEAEFKTLNSSVKNVYVYTSQYTLQGKKKNPGFFQYRAALLFLFYAYN